MDNLIFPNNATLGTFLPTFISFSPSLFLLLSSLFYSLFLSSLSLSVLPLAPSLPLSPSPSFFLTLAPSLPPPLSRCACVCVCVLCHSPHKHIQTNTYEHTFSLRTHTPAKMRNDNVICCLSFTRDHCCN